MTSGFDGMSLAVFTTVAPAGAVAFICMAIALIRSVRSDKPAARLDRYLAIPIAATLVGFIVSATHLGTPANALHVFSGVGRSPLSNEVVAAVAFLIIAGSYWMMAFKDGIPRALARVWLVVASVAGVAFLAMTSLAYAVDTVPTWDSPFTPVNLVLSALFAGPPMALFAATCAGYRSRAFSLALSAFSAVALVAGMAALCAHAASLGAVANYETSALALVPCYPAAICVHAVLGVLSVACCFVSARAACSARTECVLRVCACVLALLASFSTRIAFYLMYMTVGF